MMPVRIYFSILQENGDWSHAVYRDIATLRDDWQSKKGLGRLFVIHTGYDRPEYNSEALEEVTSDIEGPVFLTEAARWALPYMYSKCSSQPISMCHLENKLEQCPVYVSISEWGYEIPDYKDANPSLVSRALPPIITEPPSGWVDRLNKENPTLASFLFNVGIFSEKQYSDLRDLIDKEVCEDIDNYRFESLLPSTDQDDPFALFTIVPKWILELEVTRIEPTVRLQNVFNRENIRYVRDIMKYTAEDLMKLPNFGRKSLRDIAVSLLSTYQNQKNLTHKFGKDAKVIRLFDHLEHTIDKLPDVPKSVIRARLGADGNRPLTLQELGEIYGITRERIRQIEKKYLSRIVQGENWDDLLKSKINFLLQERSKPLYLDMLEVEDSWFTGFGGCLDYLSEVIIRFTEDHASIINLEERRVVCHITQGDFDDTIKNLRTTLAENVGSSWKKKAIEQMVYTKFLSHKAAELTNASIEMVLENSHFAKNADGEDIFVGLGRSAESLVSVVLAEAESPLHYSEIHERALRLTDREIDIRRIHSALTGMKDAFLYDRGVYGTKMHLPFTEEKVEEILSQAEDIISNSPPQKQWHLSELLECLEDEYAVPDELNNYNLGIILTKSEKLVSLGKQVWVSKYQDNLSNSDRIQTLDAFITILEKAGCPLTSDELIKRVSEHRGLKPTCQIHQNEVMIKLSSNTWGLINRDIPFSKDEGIKFLDAIYTHLLNTSIGIHISEISNILSSIPEHRKIADSYVLFSLCSSDPRFKIWHGHLIGLTDWESARRHNFSSAFREVYENLSGKTTVSDLHVQVEKLLGRPIEKRKVANALSYSNAYYDKETGFWSKVAPSNVIENEIRHSQVHTEDEFRMASNAF